MVEVSRLKDEITSKVISSFIIMWSNTTRGSKTQEHTSPRKKEIDTTSILARYYDHTLRATIMSSLIQSRTKI